MSFYWQQALPGNQDQHAHAQQQQSTWDSINLGAPTQPSHQFSGYNQNTTQQNATNIGGYETYVNPYTATNPTFGVAQTNGGHNWNAQQKAKQTRASSQPVHAEQIEHAPILPPPVQHVPQNTHQQQQQQQYKQQQEYQQHLQQYQEHQHYQEQYQQHQQQFHQQQPVPPVQHAHSVEPPSRETSVTHSEQSTISMPRDETPEVQERNPPVTETIQHHPEVVASVSQPAPVEVPAPVAPVQPPQPAPSVVEASSSVEHVQKVAPTDSVNFVLSQQPFENDWAENGWGDTDIVKPDAEDQPIRTSTPQPKKELIPPTHQASPAYPPEVSPVHMETAKPNEKVEETKDNGREEEEREETPSKSPDDNTSKEEKDSVDDAWVEVTSSASETPKDGRKKEMSTLHPLADSDSTQDSKRDAVNVRDRYRDVKKNYPEVLNRISQYRSSRGEKTPIRQLDALTTGRPLSTKSSTPKESDTTIPPMRNELSAIEGSRMNSSFYDQSMDVSMASRGYGDEFVDALRKERRLRRPSSRTKSEIGEPIRMYRDHRRGYDSGYSVAGYPVPRGGYLPPTGRHSVVGMPLDYYGEQQQYSRRPQSSYDAAAYQKFMKSGKPASAYDVYGEEASSDEEGEGDDVRDSDQEMRRIHQFHRQQHVPPSAYYHRAPAGLGADDYYYLGIIHMSASYVDSLLREMPPPVAFWALAPNERAAYVFLSSLKKKHFEPVDVFHNRFSMEYFRYLHDGVSPLDALCKICMSMRETHRMRIQQTQQRSYEAAQKKLFSDGNESPESRLSDRGSVYDKEDDAASDADNRSVHIGTKGGPLKFRIPHALVSFGPGGKIYRVRPDVAVSIVETTNVQHLITDPHELKLIELAKSFKGPLMVDGPSPTAMHSVQLYIDRQMDRIRRSDLGQADPKNDDVVDCLLLWQLLEMCVSQRGVVTGPAIARLLGGVPRRKKDNTVAPIDMTIGMPAADPKALERVEKFLLLGHVDEAIECALVEGLFGHALILPLLLAPHKLDYVKKKFLESAPNTSTLHGLLAVANGEPAPFLTNFPLEERSAWRSHVSILLANMPSWQTAMDSVWRLGEVLAKRDCNAAADFCFLAVSLLTGCDVFTPRNNAEVGSTRSHIDLLHGSIPDDSTDNSFCKFGFSLADFHATEIFNYAIRLSGGASPLSVSPFYQRKRIEYARLLDHWGAFEADAMRYYYDIARTMYTQNSLSPSEWSELCDLAERLRIVSAATENETMWIEHARLNMVQNPQPAAIAQQEASQKQAQHHQNEATPHYEPPQPQAPTAHSGYYDQASPTAREAPSVSSVAHSHYEEQHSRQSRAQSLSSEANDWHSEHQEPLEMKRSEEREYTSETSTETTTTASSDTSPIHRRRDDEETRRASISQQRAPPPQLQPVAGPPAPPMGFAQPPASPRVPSASAPMFPDPPAPVRQQYTHQNAQPRQEEEPKNQQNNMKKSDSSSLGGGIKGWLRNSIHKVIPTVDGGKPMILPDDSKKTIVFDPVLGRYVGEGVEEDVAAPPPPMAAMGPAADQPTTSGGPPTMPTGGGLRAARISGGSRYFNPLQKQSEGGPPVPSAAAPPPPVPPQFGFIPTMPDDAVGDSPFSEGTPQPEGEHGGQPSSSE